MKRVLGVHHCVQVVPPMLPKFARPYTVASSGQQTGGLLHRLLQDGTGAELSLLMLLAFCYLIF